MLVSKDVIDGEVRYYLTRAASVVCFMTDDGDGGISIHVEAGTFACPYSTTPEKLNSVRECGIDEIAKRLHCHRDQVLVDRRFNELAAIADKPADPNLFWFGRSRKKSHGRQ